MVVVDICGLNTGTVTTTYDVEYFGMRPRRQSRQTG